MHKTPLQIFSTFKQDKVKLANPIFKRTRQAAAKVKIEREKKVRNIFTFLLLKAYVSEEILNWHCLMSYPCSHFYFDIKFGWPLLF